MKRNRILIVLCVVLMCFQAGYAQDQTYSSYYLSNGAAINPAFTGVSKFHNVSLNIRQQWAGFKGAPSTQTISYENYLQRYSSGYGVIIVNDKLGASRQQEINASYSYKLSLENIEIMFGLNAGMAFIYNNYNELKLDESYDPQFTDKAGKIFPNIGTGILLRTETSFLSLSIPTLINGSKIYDENLSRPIRQRSYQIYASHSFSYAYDKQVRPNIYAKINENNSVDAALNVMNYFNKEFGMGVSYYTLKSIALLVNYEVLDNLNIMYTCEVSTGKISCYQLGSHELTLRYVFDKGSRYKVVNPRYF